jgi:YHS domain-containing protein
MVIRLKSVVAGIALSAVALATTAGEFNESNGVVIKGYDPVAFFKDGKPVRGKDDLRFEYKGSTFVFANAENRAAFADNPRGTRRSTAATARSAPHAATKPISILQPLPSSTAGSI